MVLWNERNLPSSAKNLDAAVRRNVIRIANALLREGYDDNRAIAIAIAQARRWHNNDPYGRSKRNLHVIPHPDGWAVHRAADGRASVVLDNQHEALLWAIDKAKIEAITVIVHNADGQFESYLDFSRRPH